MSNFHGEIKPVPEDAPVSALKPGNVLEMTTGCIERTFGGPATNKYWDGLTRAELWTGLQKLRYGKDGTWNGMNCDHIDAFTMGPRSQLNSPVGQDSAHPRMASRAPYISMFRQEGENKYRCHKKMMRFQVCSVDLPLRSAVAQCRREFLDLKECENAKDQYAGSFKNNLQKQLASFSKSINDEYLDMTSATHFSYGDVRLNAHRVGEEELKWGGYDMNWNQGGASKFF